MLPEFGPHAALLLVLLGFVMVLCALGLRVRFGAAGGASDHRDVGGPSVGRIALGVALGIVLAVVLLNLIAVALFFVSGS